MKDKQLEATGERFMPGMKGVIELEHIHRYRLASILAEGLSVLDIASGEGYGSAMMAEGARSVTGVDLSPEAIAHSQNAYKRDNLSFLVGSAIAIPIPDACVDLVVSFETIEHLSNHDAMVLELRRVLRPGGLLLISSPNKAVYSDLTGYENPFHQHELDTGQFRFLIGAYFPNVANYVQKTTGASVILPDSGLHEFLSLAPNMVQQAGLVGHRYDLLLASDGSLPDLPASLYERSDNDLQPERAELRLSELSEARNLIRDAWEKVAEVTHQAEMFRQDRDRFRQDRDRQQAAKLSFEEALTWMAQDANMVLKDRWWRRTRALRRWSNSFRKLRGRPKKHWPKHFDPLTYLPPVAPSAPGAAELGQAAAVEVGSVQESPSIKLPFLQRRLPSLQRRVSPHLTVVAMARNESSRAHDTMRHFCALFDRVVIIDHLSDDATADIARGYNGMGGAQVVVLRGQDTGYYQSEYMSAVANALLVEGRTDWIFFLDFDEFLPFADISAFRQALVDVTNEAVIHGHWFNLALHAPAVESLQGVEAIVGPHASDFVKVAINARLVGLGVTVAQGNHAVRLSGRDADEIGARAFGVLHVPIVGTDVLRRKIVQGTNALKCTSGKGEEQGAHWRDMHAHIDELISDANLAREVALQYGKSVAEIINSIAAGHRTEGTRSCKLCFAQTAAAEPAAANEVPTFSLETAAQLLSEQFKPPVYPNPFVSLNKSVYSRLPAQAASAAQDYSSQIDDALMAASTEVEVVVPTAWSSHIPFLFTLMEIQRPRRFVELGTHAGASFFAACQHMRSNGNYGESVAIDLWTGDHQAGFYDETVFSTFKHLLNLHFPTTGRFIRSYFSDAVPCFEDGSIDLLHIDGLHTYEAVKEDYETWRSKLTENGVIIFHDTNEYQTDFGVWQFFNEIRHEAQASFLFTHGHGLGVLAFGTSATNPALELLANFSKRPEKIESFYATLGKALFLAARYRYV